MGLFQEELFRDGKMGKKKARNAPADVSRQGSIKKPYRPEQVFERDTKPLTMQIGRLDNKSECLHLTVTLCP